MLFRSALMVRGSRIVLRAASTGNAAASVTKPTGVAVGDLVIVCVMTPGGAATTLTTATGSAWASASSNLSGGMGGDSEVFWKILNSTDVANAWGFSINSSYACVAYQAGDVTTVTGKSIKDDGASGGATITLTGYTPAATTRGALSCMVDGDTGPMSPPTSFVMGANKTAGTFGIGLALHDTYAGGSVVWPCTAGAGQLAHLLELTH